MTRRTVVLVSACLIVLLLAGGAWRLKRHFVPAGAGFTPFLFHSTKPQAMVSPGGRTLHVRFNDAGAMHSGFHWTYLYTDHWFSCPAESPLLPFLLPDSAQKRQQIVGNPAGRSIFRGHGPA